MQSFHRKDCFLEVEIEDLDLPRHQTHEKVMLEKNGVRGTIRDQDLEIDGEKMKSGGVFD